MAIDVRTPQYTVGEYCDQFAKGEVRVNRQYQRSDEVWPTAARSFLVETVLLNYPMPKLYLHQTTDLRTNRPQREIVDGQQRTKALVAFLHNEYFLTSNVTLAGAAGCKFSTLPSELQRQFLEYGLNFDVLVGATDEEVREVFRRMNSFTVPLNAEEHRHAVNQGQFKWFMNRLTSDYSEAFLAAGVFGQKALVRMQDQKLLTEVANACWHGITTTNKKILDRLYRDKDTVDGFSDEERRTLDRRMRHGLNQLFEWKDLFDTPLVRPHQVYSLLLATMDAQEPLESLRGVRPDSLAQVTGDVVLRNLSRLAEALEQGDDAPSKLRPFVRASEQGTNVGDKRATRFQWFARAIGDRLPR